MTDWVVCSECGAAYMYGEFNCCTECQTRLPSPPRCISGQRVDPEDRKCCPRCGRRITDGMIETGIVVQE